MNLVTSNLTAALLACGAIAAQAAPGAPELRYFELGITSPPGQASGSTGKDLFNNGNPYTGLSYQLAASGVPATPGTYQNSTFTPGAEKTGAATDVIGTQFGGGGLSFRRSDAIDTSNNLTPAGTTVYSTILRTAVVPQTALGLAQKDNGFSITSVWNYTPLQAGESIALVLSGTNGPNYTDRLNLALRSDYTTGQTGIFFEQQSIVGSTISRVTLGSIAPAAIYGDLSNVDYFGLNLFRAVPSANDPNPAVRATVTFFDAAVDGSGDLLSLGSYSFDTPGFSFLANTSGFANPFVAASWIEPSIAAVPEPGTWALMALGLAGLGFTARRRRA